MYNGVPRSKLNINCGGTWAGEWEWGMERRCRETRFHEMRKYLLGNKKSMKSSGDT